MLKEIYFEVDRIRQGKYRVSFADIINYIYGRGEWDFDIRDENGLRRGEVQDYSLLKLDFYTQFLFSLKKSFFKFSAFFRSKSKLYLLASAIISSIFLMNEGGM